MYCDEARQAGAALLGPVGKIANQQSVYVSVYWIAVEQGGEPHFTGLPLGEGANAETGDYDRASGEERLGAIHVRKPIPYHAVWVQRCSLALCFAHRQSTREYSVTMRNGPSAYAVKDREVHASTPGHYPTNTASQAHRRAKRWTPLRC